MNNRWVKLTYSIVSVVPVVALAWVLRSRAVNLLPIDYDEDDHHRHGHDGREYPGLT